MNYILIIISLVLFQTINCRRQRKMPSRLSSMNLDTNDITLSGFSSGGTFAQQFHLSYSSLFSGIAVFSDTHYGCGSGIGRIEEYESSCTKLNSNQRLRRGFNISSTISEFETNAKNGLIENPRHLLDTRLFVYTGTKSSKFTTDQSLRILEIYEPRIVSKSNILIMVQAAENVLPTNNFGGDCSDDASENFYIANCKFSGAYESLQFLLRNSLRSARRNVAVHPLEHFDQSEFFNGNEQSFMDKTGLMYIPSGCRDSAVKCFLHFYFHGCLTGMEFNGTNHIENSGFLQVAELNNIVMIFPQALSSDENEEGCWDTFGLTGSLFATQKGRQIEIMRKIIERLIPNLTRRIEISVGLTSPQDITSDGIHFYSLSGNNSGSSESAGYSNSGSSGSTGENNPGISGISGGYDSGQKSGGYGSLSTDTDYPSSYYSTSTAVRTIPSLYPTSESIRPIPKQSPYNKYFPNHKLDHELGNSVLYLPSEDMAVSVGFIRLNRASQQRKSSTTFPPPTFSSPISKSPISSTNPPRIQIIGTTTAPLHQTPTEIITAPPSQRENFQREFDLKKNDFVDVNGADSLTSIPPKNNGLQRSFPSLTNPPERPNEHFTQNQPVKLAQRNLRRRNPLQQIQSILKPLTRGFLSRFNIK